MQSLKLGGHDAEVGWHARAQRAEEFVDGYPCIQARGKASVDGILLLEAATSDMHKEGVRIGGLTGESVRLLLRTLSSSAEAAKR